MKPKLRVVRSLSPARAMSGARGLLADVREMILEARQTVARGVNAALVVLYWNIRQRIRRDILKEKRADGRRHRMKRLIFSAFLAIDRSEVRRYISCIISPDASVAGREAGSFGSASAFFGRFA